VYIIPPPMSNNVPGLLIFASISGKKNIATQPSAMYKIICNIRNFPNANKFSMNPTAHPTHKKIQMPIPIGPPIASRENGVYVPAINK